MTTKKLNIPVAAIKNAAKAKQAKHPVKSTRPQLLSQARKAVEDGKLPPVLHFTSEANYSYNRHSEAMHALAKAGDVKALTAYLIKGTNTYARALAGYRDLLVTAAKAAKPAKATKKAPAKAKAKAKVKA